METNTVEWLEMFVKMVSCDCQLFELFNVSVEERTVRFVLFLLFRHYKMAEWIKQSSGGDSPFHSSNTCTQFSFSFCIYLFMFYSDLHLVWHTDLGGAAIAPPSSLVEKDCE